MNTILEAVKKIKLPYLTSFSTVCLDLGTSKTRIAIKDKGIVLRDDSYIGYNKRLKDYIFFGSEAKEIVGKVPQFIQIITPVIHGVISDFDASVALVNYFISKAVKPYFSNFNLIKPPLQAISAVPVIATEIEQKAVEEVLLKCGFNQVFLIEKPNVTAMGYGHNIFSHNPVFIVDLGAGLIEMAIISGGGTVVQKTIKNAGNYMNKQIANYLYLKNGIILGKKTCELLKTTLLNFEGKEKTIMIRGKSLETGLPKSIRVKTSDIKEALLNSFHQIIDGIKELIELSPPELVNEVLNSGIILTGGMANIKGLDRFFSNELKINTYLQPTPEDTTIKGLLKLSQNKKSLFKLKLNK